MALGRYKKWRKRVRRRWKHQPGWRPWVLSLLPRAGLWLVRNLPPRVSLRFAEGAGRLMWLSPKRREIGLRNLARALPDSSEDERKRIGRTSCGLVVRSIAEPLSLGPRMGPAGIQGLMDLTPTARELLASTVPTGAVLVQGHFGSMEAALSLFASVGPRILTVVRQPPNYYVARALSDGREGWGVALTVRDGALKRLRSHLRDNGSVCLLMDVNARRGGIFVPWFGRLASTEPAAAWLALKTGRPLIACWNVRSADCRSWLAGAQLIRPESPPEKPTREQLHVLTAGIHEALEDVIRRHPEQYFWIHDRYRTRPPDEA